MALTDEQIKRLTGEWSRVTGETVSITSVGSFIYMNGSELACLRMFHHYKDPTRTKVRLLNGVWVFSLEKTF